MATFLIWCWLAYLVKCLDGVLHPDDSTTPPAVITVCLVLNITALLIFLASR